MQVDRPKPASVTASPCCRLALQISSPVCLLKVCNGLHWSQTIGVYLWYPTLEITRKIGMMGFQVSTLPSSLLLLKKRRKPWWDFCHVITANRQLQQAESRRSPKSILFYQVMISTPKTLLLQEIEHATRPDVTLQAVSKTTETGNWYDYNKQPGIDLVSAIYTMEEKESSSL